MPEVTPAAAPDLGAIIAEQISKALAGPLAALTDLKSKVDKAGVTPPIQTQETPADTPKSYSRVTLLGADPKEKGLRAAQYVRALAMSTASTKAGQHKSALECAKELYGEEYSVTKAMAATSFTAGGAIMPDVLSSELIEFLRERAIVAQMGAVVLPMTEGKLRIAKITGTSQAAYQGENLPATNTEPTLGDLELSAKKLMANVPLSMDLVRRAGPAADALVRDDLVRSITLTADQAFLRGPGTQYSPKGLRYWAPTANVLTMTATPTLTTATNDIARLYLTLRRANVRMIRPGWIMSPGIESYLYNLLSTTGNFVYRDEMNQGKLRGFPFAVSTSVPETLGGGGDESELYLVDFADAIIAETTQIIIDTSTEAAYEVNGVAVSAWSRDQMVIRAILEHDFGMRHDASVAVLTGVKWV